MRHDLAGRYAFKVGLVERVDGRAEAIAPRPRQARSGRPRADIDAANRWRAYTSGWRVGARSGALDPGSWAPAERFFRLGTPLRRGRGRSGRCHSGLRGRSPGVIRGPEHLAARDREKPSRGESDRARDLVRQDSGVDHHDVPRNRSSTDGAARRTVAPSAAPPPPVAVAAAAPVSDIEMARERERTRRWIALAVIALLASVVVPGAVGLMRGTLSVGDVRELLASLGVLTTLVGTAMGFYFGRTTR